MQYLLKLQLKMSGIFFETLSDAQKYFSYLLGVSTCICSAECQQAGVTCLLCALCRALSSICSRWRGCCGWRDCCRNLTAITSTASSCWRCWWPCSRYWRTGSPACGISSDEKSCNTTPPTGLSVWLPSYSRSLTAFYAFSALKIHGLPWSVTAFLIFELERF